METELDQLLQTLKPKTISKENLIPEEKRGLKWLETHVTSQSIAIVSADKGGSILIVDPKMLRKKTLEKLDNSNLYKKLDTDPLPTLHQELFKLWVEGKNKGFVSPEEAKYVMGISDNLKKDGSGPTNRPSTSPHYKPGKSYFYPSLKIHKLAKEDIKPGVEPPIRLITALQDGISKRSDVFFAAKFLRTLEKEYCQDLLTDTTDALIWLDNVNETSPKFDKRQFKAFTFDFKALYDSLSPALVLEALDDAITTCRPDWPSDLKTWVLALVHHSLKCSIGVFEDHWYEQVNGVPTGGSLCVQIANMTVFYILNKYVYTNKALMKDIPTVKRFIDDGAGLYKGTSRQFNNWIQKVNELISPFGLNIDEFQIENTGEYVNFLDIKFMFDLEGVLQTDLYIKETASRAYLHYTSTHPNHVFAGIIYSQCLRLRRIINSTERLKAQLELLKEAFLASGYPPKMIDNISNKVFNSERIIARKQHDIVIDQKPLSALPVRVVSCFSSDEDLVNVVNKYEPHLRRTRSFSESDSSPPTPGPLQRTCSKRKKLFQFVKKTGSSLRARLINSKELALGPKHGRTQPCQKKRCKCCDMVLDKDSLCINGKRVRVAPGNCKTYNVIYLVQCTLCEKAYVGRTVNHLHIRLDGHRSKFYEIVDGRAVDVTSDEYSLGVHLLDHGLKEHSDFNKHYKVCIIENCAPKLLEVKENKYIHALKTLRPLGLNTVNPFGLKLFH
jgi:hypothetical protein